MSKAKTLVIDGGTALTPTLRFSPARVIIQGTSIAEVGPATEIRLPAGADKIDASGFIVTPGFIDPHIHGCGGVDVMDGSYESLDVVSRIVARHGTTAFLATTVSSPPETLHAAVEKLGSLMGLSFGGATPIGIHLEGPFISAAKRGTHPAPDIAVPDTTLFRRWLEASKQTVRLVTVAPELDGMDSVLRLARDSGVSVAMGHSNATFEQAAAAADRGMSYAVHTFNAMREFRHRDPGIVGEVLLDDRIFAEIIADGIHVDPEVVRLFARLKSRARVILATDAISAAGMPDGRYLLGKRHVNMTGGICRDADGRLAGSTLSQEMALRNFVDWTGCSLEDALLGLTENPAKALGLKKKGTLAPGSDADIAILDTEFRVMKTLVAGKLVFDRT